MSWRPGFLRCAGQAVPAILAVAFLLVGSAPARSQTASDSSLVITTTPRVPGIKFTLNGRRFTTDDRGRARVEVSEGSYRVRVERHVMKAGDRTLRVRFASWSDGSTALARDVFVTGSTLLRASFDVDYLVRPTFVDQANRSLDASRVQSVTAIASSGATVTFPGVPDGLKGPTALIWERHPTGTLWLRGDEVAAGAQRPTMRRISYRAREVVVDGDRFPATSTDYQPGSGDAWSIQVLAQQARLQARDWLFRFPVDGAIMAIVYPDDTTTFHRSESDSVVFLPPGRYHATAYAPGIPLSASFSTPGPEEVHVAVIGYLDIIVIAVVVLSAVAVLAARHLLGQRLRPE